MQYLKNPDDPEKKFTREEVEAAFLQVLSSQFGITTFDELKTESHKADGVTARSIYWVILNDFDPDLNELYLGKIFGKNRATVYHAFRKHAYAFSHTYKKSYAKYAEKFLVFVNEVRKILFGKFSPYSPPSGVLLPPPPVSRKRSHYQKITGEQWDPIIEQIIQGIKMYFEIPEGYFREGYEPQEKCSEEITRLRALFLGMVYFAVGPETDRAKRMTVAEIGQVVEPPIPDSRVREYVSMHRGFLSESQYRFDHAAIVIQIPKLWGVSAQYNKIEIEEILNA